MKRTLCIFICLFSFGISMYGQNQAKIDQITNQMKQLYADYAAKKITIEEYKQKDAELLKELQAAFEEGFDSTPVDGKKLEQLYDQQYTLTAAHRDGKISDTEYQTRVRPITDEINKIMERKLTSSNSAIVLEAHNNVKKLWPGSNPGWPPAEGKNSVREVCNLGPFTQPSGTRASYSLSFPGGGSELGSIRIYITGNTNTIYREMQNQIEGISGRKMESKPDSSYGTQNLEIYMPRGSFPLDRYIYLGITKDNAVLVEFQRRFSSGH